MGTQAKPSTLTLKIGTLVKITKRNVKAIRMLTNFHADNIKSKYPKMRLAAVDAQQEVRIYELAVGKTYPIHSYREKDKLYGIRVHYRVIFFPIDCLEVINTS